MQIAIGTYDPLVGVDQPLELRLERVRNGLRHGYPSGSCQLKQSISILRRHAISWPTTSGPWNGRERDWTGLERRGDNSRI